MGAKRKKQKQVKNKFANLHTKELREILKKDAKEFASLYEIGKSITSTVDLRKILALITEKIAKVMKADVCTLRLLEGKARLVLRSAYGLSKNAVELIKDIRVGEGIVGNVAEKLKPIIIKDLSKGSLYNRESFACPKKLYSLVSVPLVEMDKVIGVFSIYSKKKEFYRNYDKMILSIFASQAAVAIENARLFENTRSNYINTMRFFASIIDAKDSYTTEHSHRVMKNVLRLAERLNLSNRQKEVLRYASILHDIGKVSIDTSILNKPGPLTEEEWKQIVRHPVIGSKIIKRIGFLDDLIPVILHHHEKYGGGGYPDSTLKGSQIPLEARILAIADAYEAMTSDRPYRKALSEEEVMEELKRNAGSQFDPQIVKMFLEILKKSK